MITVRRLVLKSGFALRRRPGKPKVGRWPALGLSVLLWAAAGLELAHAGGGPTEHGKIPGLAGLFAQPGVHDVNIELSGAAARSLAQNPRKHVPAKVTIDGQAYGGAELHLKGSIGSFRGLDDKPGLTMSFVSPEGNGRFRHLK